MMIDIESSAPTAYYYHLCGPQAATKRAKNLCINISPRVTVPAWILHPFHMTKSELLVVKSNKLV